ncbi:MAG TPA: response regulator [Bacteroidia bacterium]|jgi:CheY-like chemotaxis protein|nr:response regulator [Bacteroidia bacterium]
MKNNRPILLVEDDKIDAMTVMRALKDLKITNTLVHVSNGLEALDHLKNMNSEKPCIILLDLNMPKMNGIELLKVLKNDALLKKLPVVVLTTSNAEKDKTESFNLSVAGYMLKPVDYKQFVDVIKDINFYWTISEIPD